MKAKISAGVCMKTFLVKTKTPERDFTWCPKSAPEGCNNQILEVSATKDRRDRKFQLKLRPIISVVDNNATAFQF